MIELVTPNPSWQRKERTYSKSTIDERAGRFVVLVIITSRGWNQIKNLNKFILVVELSIKKVELAAKLLLIMCIIVLE